MRARTHVWALSSLCWLVVGCGSDSSARPEPAPDVVQPVVEQPEPLVLSCGEVDSSAAQTFYKLDMPAGVATYFDFPFSEDHQGMLTVDDDYYRLVFDGLTSDDWIPLTKYANDILGRMETRIDRHTGDYWTEFKLPWRRVEYAEYPGSVNTMS